MCGRYYIGLDSEEEWLAILEALNRKGAPEGMKTSGEIFPSDIVPVLANNRQGERRPFAHALGLFLPGRAARHQRPRGNGANQAALQGWHAPAPLPCARQPLF